MANNSSGIFKNKTIEKVKQKQKSRRRIELGYVMQHNLKLLKLNQGSSQSRTGRNFTKASWKPDNLLNWWKIELGDKVPHNIKLLELWNQVVYPVSYSKKFYRDVFEAGELAKLAYYNDIVHTIHRFLARL